MQDPISSWQLQWQLPSTARLQPGQAVYGASLSTAPGSDGRNVSALKLPEAALLEGNRGNTSLQVSAQLDQQQAAGNLSSPDSGNSSADISISNVSFNGVACRLSTQDSSSSSQSEAIGTLTFQATPAGSQSDAATSQQCSFDLRQAEDSWKQDMQYILPSACSLSFCCGTQLASSPSGAVDVYGFPAGQSADRIRNLTSPTVQVWLREHICGVLLVMSTSQQSYQADQLFLLAFKTFSSVHFGALLQRAIVRCIRECNCKGENN